jgi:hypothetical protein
VVTIVDRPAAERVLAVSCPTCDARPGDPCVRKRGVAHIVPPHLARHDRAVELVRSLTPLAVGHSSPRNAHRLTVEHRNGRDVYVTVGAVADAIDEIAQHLLAVEECSYREVGIALGISRQAAEKRYPDPSARPAGGQWAGLRRTLGSRCGERQHPAPVGRVSAAGCDVFGLRLAALRERRRCVPLATRSTSARAAKDPVCHGPSQRSTLRHAVP